MSLRAALTRQADACDALGSEFTARLLRLTAARLQRGTPVADRMLDWPGDVSGAGASVPLRFAGALHGLILMGHAPELAPLWPPHAVTDDTLWAGVEAAMRAHQGELLAWLDNAPQTNEVRRSAALIAVGHILSARYGLPIRLSELGASAGLNLFWDHYALAAGGQTLGPEAPALTLTPDWSGPLPLPCDPFISDRRGVDLHPLSPSDPADRNRLRAYTWPDQPDRMARLDAALSVATPVVDQGDAAAWLVNRMADMLEGQLDFVYHTVAWQYFPPGTRAACTAALEARGEKATMRSPLAWLSVEADTGGAQQGAAMVLRLWPGDRTPIRLGRMDFHGRWIDWRC